MKSFKGLRLESLILVLDLVSLRITLLEQTGLLIIVTNDVGDYNETNDKKTLSFK